MKKTAFILTAGQKFAHWTVVCRSGSDKFNNSLWTCVCSCGETRKVRGIYLGQQYTRHTRRVILLLAVTGLLLIGVASYQYIYDAKFFSAKTLINHNWNSPTREGRFAGLFVFHRGYLGNVRSLVDVGIDDRFVESAPDIPFDSNPRAIAGYQSIVSSFGGIGSRPRSLSHLFQLTIVDKRNYDVHDYTSSGDFYEPSFPASNVFFKLYGFAILIIGSTIGFFAHFVLLWRGWSHWKAWRRLTLGIGGWVVAAILIWHGAALLLGID